MGMKVVSEPADMIFFQLPKINPEEKFLRKNNEPQDGNENVKLINHNLMKFTIFSTKISGASRLGACPTPGIISNPAPKILSFIE